MTKTSRSYTQSREELVEHLRRQVRFLEGSAAAYDAGDEDEAYRLALHVRVLVHDTRSSSSLLGLLGLKDKLRYADTSLDLKGVPEGSVHLDAGLASMEIQGPGGADPGGRYVALLDDVPPERLRPPVPFSQWWQKVVLGRFGFGRRQLVLSVANQDGGAHVDDKLEEVYAALTRHNALGWSYQDSEGRDLPFAGNVALASVRQIAHELLMTVRRELTGLLEPEGAALGDALARATGRNAPCPCGSGRKFKHCHGG